MTAGDWAGSHLVPWKGIKQNEGGYVPGVPVLQLSIIFGRVGLSYV